jgi:hypothetical protein
LVPRKATERTSEAFIDIAVADHWCLEAAKNARALAKGVKLTEDGRSDSPQLTEHNVGHAPLAFRHPETISAT